MPKAVLHNGVIQPVEPLPADWKEGQELRVDKVEEADLSADEIDRDFAELERLCSRGDAADDDKVARILHEAHEQAKEQVRRSMGLES
jgi:hypothetical protein